MRQSQLGLGPPPDRETQLSLPQHDCAVQTPSWVELLVPMHDLAPAPEDFGLRGWRGEQGADGGQWTDHEQARQDCAGSAAAHPLERLGQACNGRAAWGRGTRVKRLCCFALALPRG